MMARLISAVNWKSGRLYIERVFNLMNDIMKQGYRMILMALVAGGLLGSCNLYRPYSRPEVKASGLYRSADSPVDTLAGDTTNMGNLPWQVVFKDTRLQELINAGLENNPDLQIATLRVQEYQARLSSARLAYTPTLGLAPSGTVSSFDKGAATQTYQLPVTASWEVDLFGKLLNAKRGAKAALLQSEAYQQAVRTQVIASVANGYYTLLMLDRQLAISEATVMSWKESVETIKALKEAGMVNEAAVAQSQANSFAVAASLPDLKRQIRETENALSLLLGQPAGMVKRGTIEEQQMPEELSAGVSVQLLSNRPDVRQAEMGLAAACASTSVARSAFYPQLKISADGGWTNSAGSMIINPGKLIATATAGLVQPIFNRGLNKANLRIAKAQQQEAQVSFSTSLLNAGNEVSNALYQYKTAEEKQMSRSNQVLALEKSVEYTQALLRLGSSTYLEVLTAQQALLSAQLSSVSDRLQQMQAVVNLYRALGGGR